MTSYNYSISAYYDFGCSSSPIIMMSSKSGCYFEHLCAPTNLPNAPYVAQSSSCSSLPITIPDPTRDYVVKSLFPYSETCSGLPLTQYVVAADYSCHPNPQAGNNANIAYFRTSCNGAMPIWDECLDSLCTNCTSTAANKACLLGGAGTSNGFQCIKAQTTKSIQDTPPSVTQITSISSSPFPSTLSPTAAPTSTPTSSDAIRMSQIFLLPVVLFVTSVATCNYFLP